MHLTDYTLGIPQRLDTGVNSVVTAKTSTALRQRKRAQRCDSDGADSNVTALTVTTLERNSGGNDSAEITMCTSM